GQWVSSGDRGGDRLAGGPFPTALPATHLPLHVRARLHGGVSVVLSDCGWLQRICDSLGEPRRHALGGVAGASSQASSVQTANGLDVSVGVLRRWRFQLRL